VPPAPPAGGFSGRSRKVNSKRKKPFLSLLIDSR